MQQAWLERDTDCWQDRRLLDWSTEADSMTFNIAVDNVASSCQLLTCDKNAESQVGNKYDAKVPIRAYEAAMSEFH